jgi:hypothetical protein
MQPASMCSCEAPVLAARTQSAPANFVLRLRAHTRTRTSSCRHAMPLRQPQLAATAESREQKWAPWTEHATVEQKGGRAVRAQTHGRPENHAPAPAGRMRAPPATARSSGGAEAKATGRSAGKRDDNWLSPSGEWRVALFTSVPLGNSQAEIARRRQSAT